MKIQQFSQIGKRSNNEDSLGMSGGLLTVCDGMGGHNYGERASAFVKEAMLKAFAEPKPIGKMEIQQQLNQVQTDLNQLLENEPELEKMGTTFTGVFITPDVWYAAHIGDSRIYLFRPSEQKLWHTWDHSLVGDLMRTHEITIEAGRFHPMSNRISKAIIAQKDGKTSSASIVKIDELKAGDIFLICSDGVVEGWGDLELVELFSDSSLSFEQKCERLALQCNANSKDNNTAIIAEIEEADAFSFGTNDELDWTTFAEVEADYQKYVKEIEAPEHTEASETPAKPAVPVAPEPENHATKHVPQPKPKPQAPKPQTVPQPVTKVTKKSLFQNRWLMIIVLVVLLALVTLGTFFVLRGCGHNEAEETQNTNYVLGGQTYGEHQEPTDINNAKGNNTNAKGNNNTNAKGNNNTNAKGNNNTNAKGNNNTNAKSNNNTNAKGNNDANAKGNNNTNAKSNNNTNAKGNNDTNAKGNNNTNAKSNNNTNAKGNNNTNNNGSEIPPVNQNKNDIKKTLLNVQEEIEQNTNENDSDEDDKFYQTIIKINDTPPPQQIEKCKSYLEKFGENGKHHDQVKKLLTQLEQRLPKKTINKTESSEKTQGIQGPAKQNEGESNNEKKNKNASGKNGSSNSDQTENMHNQPTIEPSSK